MHSISGGCASLVNYLVTTVANKKAGVPVSSAAAEDEKTKTKKQKKKRTELQFCKSQLFHPFRFHASLAALCPWSVCSLCVSLIRHTRPTLPVPG